MQYFYQHNIALKTMAIIPSVEPFDGKREGPGPQQGQLSVFCLSTLPKVRMTDYNAP